MPTGVHNGSQIVGVRRSKCIEAIAEGQSIADIAHELRMSDETVRAIKRAEWPRIESRRAILTAQAEQIADLAAEHAIASLRAAKLGSLPLPVVNPVWGTALDKVTMLRGDAVLTVRHDHTHRIVDDDILAFAVARSAKATVIDSQPLLTNGDATTRENGTRSRTKKRRPSSTA